jgi:hypothetical protein
VLRVRIWPNFGPSVILARRAHPPCVSETAGVTPEQTEEPFEMRVPRLITNTLLVVGSLVASVLLAEGLIRVFYPQKLFFSVSQWDPHVGFSNTPGLEGYSRTSEFVMRISINSRGLRDREIDYLKPRDVFRIGLFGDSFTFGEGVQNNESYPKVVEQLLNSQNRNGEAKPIEVINFGIGKTGTSHQLAFYQKEGVKYQLDLVIVGFFAGNDFSDNWSGVFYLKGDSLVHQVGTYSRMRKIQRFLYAIPGYKWAATHSHLVNLFRKAATVLDDRARTAAAASLNEPLANATADTSDQKVHLTVRLIEEFSRQAQLHGSDFLLLKLPKRGQRPTSMYAATDSIPQYVVQCDQLLAAMQQKRIRTLDLIPLFATLPESTHFFVQDGHMTALGNQAVARSLHQYLIENALVPMSSRQDSITPSKRPAS